MNVASCQKCAGYGVTMFRFNVEEKLALSPTPTAEPTLVPSPEPSTEPSPQPSEEEQPHSHGGAWSG